MLPVSLYLLPLLGNWSFGGFHEVHAHHVGVGRLHQLTLVLPLFRIHKRSLDWMTQRMASALYGHTLL
jgi:hypothetical protein